jgi:outer membrane protein assembly factor BamA
MGLGVVFNVDTRDNYFSPLKGGLYQFQTNFTSKVMGSTHSFNNYQLDFRKYFPILNRHVLAVQFYSRLTFGDSPFQARAVYGGADVARGYFRGRFIDDHLYVIQAEYRLPVAKRWELAAFVLTGNVGNATDGFNSPNKSSIGAGPRYFISKNNRSCLRLDIGVNSYGGTGIYFGVNEAF